MKETFNKKNILTMTPIVIVDILILGGWILYLKPSQDMAIILIYVFPILFVANFFIAGIVYFIKKRYTPFFMLNAAVSVIMIWFFFALYTEIESRKYNKYWKFRIENTNYLINYSPFYDIGDNYRISINLENGFFERSDRGNAKTQNDTIYFSSIDSTEYYIYKGYLYNFKNIEKIKVKKTHR